MSQLKLIGLTLMALISIAITTASAQAAELAILPAKQKFAFKSAENVILETLGGTKVECHKGVTGSGETTTSESLGAVTFKFLECLTGGIPCTGLSDTSGNITAKGEFHLRHLLPASEGVNLAILVTEAHFSCLVLVTVTGCIASMDLLTKANGVSAVNLLLSTMFVAFLLKTKGDPEPLSIDTANGLAMENCELTTTIAGTAEKSAELASGTIEKCEAAGVACTFLVELSGTF